MTTQIQIDDKITSNADIMVVVVPERNTKTGRMENIVSHGINMETDKMVIMSGGSPESIGAVFDKAVGEYMIYGQPATAKNKSAAPRG